MQKTKVFIAYAREDEEYLNRLRKYLAPLERETIETWYDGKIEAGELWDEKIKTYLHAADIILLLVSANSLASDYFYDKEMKDALARHEREEAIVVPVILKYCDWKETPFSKLQVVPKDAKPITAWSDDSEAYYNVTQSIKANVKTIQKRKKQATPYVQATRPQPTTSATKSQTTTNIKPVSNNNNFGKILKIALPVLIGIVGIFGIFNWINNRPTVAKKEQGITKIAKERTPTPPKEVVIENPTEPTPPTGMVYVQGGTFRMGCTAEQGSDCGSDESPAHSVTVSDFYMGEHEVTNQQYADFLNAKGNQSEEGTEWYAIESIFAKIEKSANSYNPKSRYANHPVMLVSWYGARAYCDWMTQKTGQKYRLPTEAEWEYAARGGINKEGYKYSGSNTLDRVGWYAENIKGTSTMKVKTLSPNALGLYDMSGNVFEWCLDSKREYNSNIQNNPKGASSGSNRVLRGGGWSRNARSSRVSGRNFNTPTSRNSYYGFRVVSPVY